jgi:hypothetical protein
MGRNRAELVFHFINMDFDDSGLLCRFCHNPVGNTPQPPVCETTNCNTSRNSAVGMNRDGKSRSFLAGRRNAVTCRPGIPATRSGSGFAAMAAAK